METLKEAHRLGLRTYGMFCPLLPGIADTHHQIEELIKFAVEGDVEEIFAEAINPRGRGLILTQQALEAGGHHTEAVAIERIRNKANWSAYVVQLIQNMQRSVRTFYDIRKLKFLQYPSGLRTEDLNKLKQDNKGIIWLGNNKSKAKSQSGQ